MGLDDPRLSLSIRLALAAAPSATAGPFAWKTLAQGFEVSTLPVLAVDRMAAPTEVDSIDLTRIDPVNFRFEVRTAAYGDKGLDQWMHQLGAALVVNGSYYSRRGTPDTPLVSAGVALGPRVYDARGGAFVASQASASVQDLSSVTWQAVFTGADNAFVSYPLLVTDGKSRTIKASRWLANRSFVGQDTAGRILIGTTRDAFFSLERLARFLADAPLDLVSALNLDGGPVANQGVSLDGYSRNTYGRWELQADSAGVELLTWPYGTVAKPIVIAVFPKIEGESRFRKTTLGYQPIQQP